MDILTFLRAQWDRVLAWALMGLGGVVLAISYQGVRHTPFVADQLSYLASGGLGGLWLVGVGGSLLIAANLSDEWRKLDEVKILIQRVLDDDGPASQPGANGNGVAISQPRPLKAAGRVVAARGAQRGATELRAVAGLGIASALAAAVVIASGWASARSAATAGDAFASASVGALGLVVLAVGATSALIRARQTFRVCAGEAFAVFAIADELKTAAGVLSTPTREHARLVHVSGSSWIHHPNCVIARGQRTVLGPARPGGVVCPLCHPAEARALP